MTRVVSPGQLGAFVAKQPLHQFGPTSRSVIHRDSVDEQDGAPPIICRRGPCELG
jgi:hypothetical protein